VQRQDDNRIGVMVVLIGLYLFMHVVPFAEILVVYLHIRIPLVALMWGLVSVMALFTLRLPHFFQSPVAIPWMGLLVMLVLASVFGSYPSYSTSFILGYASRFHVIPLLICATVLTTRQVRHVIFWMIGAHLLALLICWKYGQLADGRLSVPDIDFQNPNDLALVLMFGTCLLLLLVYLRSFVAKLFCLGMVGISVIYILRTGSRAGFVCLTIVGISVFMFASVRVRIALLAAAPSLAMILILVIPHSIWSRLSLIATDTRAEYSSTVDEDLRRAIESQVARTNLQKRAINLTLKHPLLGVGPLMFADAADAVSRLESGKKTAWQGTHDVYLQIASEAGIPALIFYVWSILLCIKLNYQSMKLCRGMPGHRMSEAQSFCLLQTTVAFGVGIFFCNFTFGPQLPMLIGLAAANALAVRKEVSLRSDATAAAGQLSMQPRLAVKKLDLSQGHA
jgi:O-antigen ligase